MLIIGKRTKNKSKEIKEGEFVLNLNEDVWDIPKILKDINDKDLVEIQAIYNFLKEQIIFPDGEKSWIEEEVYVRLQSSEISGIKERELLKGYTLAWPYREKVRERLLEGWEIAYEIDESNKKRSILVVKSPVLGSSRDLILMKKMLEK